jgi:hypothetical protein
MSEMERSGEGRAVEPRGGSSTSRATRRSHRYRRNGGGGAHVGRTCDRCASHRKDGDRAASPWPGEVAQGKGKVEDLMITRLTIKELTVERVR